MPLNEAAAAATKKEGAVVGETSQLSLTEAYPVNSILKLTLTPTNEVVEGLVYCTDEISNTIVLTKSLNYTTLASEVRIVNVSCVVKKEVVSLVAPTTNSSGNGDNGGSDTTNDSTLEVSIPLTSISKKTIEEREKRAKKLAEESFEQINQKVSDPTIRRHCIGRIGRSISISRLW
jgi:hypothetical protein